MSPILVGWQEGRKKREREEKRKGRRKRVKDGGRGLSWRDSQPAPGPWALGNRQLCCVLGGSEFSCSANILFPKISIFGGFMDDGLYAVYN